MTLTDRWASLRDPPDIPMTTHLHVHDLPKRGRRPAGVRPGSTVPKEVATRLRDVGDAVEQLGAIAQHTLPEMIRKIAWQVGHAKAEDLAMDVIERHLVEHAAHPRDGYCTVEGYHRLRASLIRSTVNASIDHLRRKGTWVEMPVGSFFDEDAHHNLPHNGAGLTTETQDEGVHRQLDAAALYDGLRRLDARDAELLRMKLEGSTFTDLARHLGVRSTNAAFKHYQRAVCAVQKVLERYGAGGYCTECAPYLLLVRQEVAATPGAERPLTDMIGAERARAIRLHVYGDPQIASDDGCAGCRTAGREHEIILGSFLPAPLLILPAVGLVAAVKGAVGGAWSGLTGWLGGMFGGGGAAVGAGVSAKGTAIVAAAAIAVGGSVTVRNAVHDAPSSVRAKVAVQASSAVTPSVALAPRRAPRARPSAPATLPSRTTATPSAPEAEFAPTPWPRASAARLRPARATAGGSALGEFAPGP